RSARSRRARHHNRRSPAFVLPRASPSSRDRSATERSKTTSVHFSEGIAESRDHQYSVAYVPIEGHRHSLFGGHRQALAAGGLRPDRKSPAFVSRSVSPSPPRQVAYVPIEGHQHSFLEAHSGVHPCG